MVTSRSSSFSSAGSTPEEQHVTIFVKQISGETIHFRLPPTTTLPALHQLLSLRTCLPPASIRLSYSSRVLTSPSSTIESLNIPSNATLTMTTRIRGGAPKKIRCAMKECKEKAQPIVGDCGFCSGRFCAKHRMLEDHDCSGLEDCKKESRERNAFKLESERTIANQGLGY